MTTWADLRESLNVEENLALGLLLSLDLRGILIIRPHGGPGI
jgi:hypothetical protein